MNPLTPPSATDSLHTDPLQPDSACLPLLPCTDGQPLFVEPTLLQGDYWADGLVRVEKSDLALTLDSLTGIKGHATTLQPGGMAGDPMPYQFKTDNFVTITLLVSFFLVVWVISRSRHFLQSQVKDFFHQRHHESLFAERTQNELRGQLFLIFQTCFVLGILYFDFTQERLPQVFAQVSPYKLLGLGVGICCLYYLLKIGLYSFVNAIFFTRQQSANWNDAYLLSVLGLGLALLPVALLVVYFNLAFTHLAWLFFCALVIDKILLLYKCHRIFFKSAVGLVHLFLYFCTLEIVPLLILLHVLVYANTLLQTNQIV